MEIQHKWITLFSCVVMSTVIHGFSGGPPLTTCGSMQPGHGFANQVVAAPYTVSFDSTMYGPGARLAVYISGVDFKGVHCQVRNNDSEPVGQFYEFDEENFKTLDCDDKDKSAVTHRNGDTKNDNEQGMTRFMWMAPDSDMGHLRARCTVVRNFQTYWVGLESTTITFDSDATPGPTQYPPTTVEAEDEDDDDIGTAIIVGLAVGATLLLSLLGFGLWRWWR